MDPQNDQKPNQVYGPDNGQPDYRSRGLTSNPYSTPQPPDAQPQAPAQNGSINDPPEKPGLKLPKGPVLAGIIGGVLVLVLLVVVLLASSGGGDKKLAQDNSDKSALTPALQPATSVELEQTSNAISQDLSGLDDEKDLPNDSLGDQTLGL